MDFISINFITSSFFLAIKRLFDMHILCCANSERQSRHLSLTEVRSSGSRSQDTIQTTHSLQKDFDNAVCYCKTRTVHGKS